ncbi:lectin isoform X2 [Triplophysa rosa]|uniref:lectin isoform X2 n=1 Tax=Triplophysa rosa TaxID=992332 RepID=UPI002545C3D5|nr:lectin isoform X2 [Triplophysa rosa]
MYKAGTRFIWLFTLLWGTGNFFTVKRGGSAGYVNVTAYSQLPKECNVDGFKNWFNVDKFCVQYFSNPLNFSQAEFSCRAKAPGGHLVSVHNRNSNYDLLAIVMKFNPKNLRIWLGGYEFFKMLASGMMTLVQSKKTTYAPSNERVSWMSRLRPEIIFHSI